MQFLKKSGLLCPPLCPQVEWHTISTSDDALSTLAHSADFTLHVHIPIVLSLTWISISQQVFLAWCYGACCPQFPVVSTPTSSGRWPPFLVLILLGGFVLLKRSFPLNCHLRTGDWIEQKFRCSLFVSLAKQLVLVCITLNGLLWILIN